MLIIASLKQFLSSSTDDREANLRVLTLSLIQFKRAHTEYYSAHKNVFDVSRSLSKIAEKDKELKHQEKTNAHFTKALVFFENRVNVARDLKATIDAPSTTGLSQLDMLDETGTRGRTRAQTATLLQAREVRSMEYTSSDEDSTVSHESEGRGFHPGPGI